MSATNGVPFPPLYQRLVDLFDELGWDAIPVPGEPILGVTVRAESGVDYTLVASTDEVARVVSFFARPPAAVPEDRRDDIVHLLNAANFVLNDGTWTMDRDDGELRFRTAVQCGSNDVSDDQLRRAAGYTIVGAEAQLPSLSRWISGEIDFEDARAELVLGGA